MTEQRRVVITGMSTKAITASWIPPPPTNYSTLDPDCDLDVVPNVARRMEVNAVLIKPSGLAGRMRV